MGTATALGGRSTSNGSTPNGLTPDGLTEALTREDMDLLIAAHLEAESRGDTAGSVAVYTDDVEHDVVGSPAGPVHGKAAAQAVYDHLVANIHTETMAPVRSYYGDDFCVIEHTWTGTVPGEFLGVPGKGRRVSFRMLHVWEFKDRLISRENVWLDGGTALQQLTAPEPH
jgi:steroid delta-isomerase-like uncharacterized protein